MDQIILLMINITTLKETSEYDDYIPSAWGKKEKKKIIPKKS